MTLKALENPLDDWDNLPISYTRIGYQNLLTAASDTEAEKALLDNTYERWVDAAGTMQATFQPPASVKMDYIAIGAHNLGSTGSTILVETSPTVAGTFTERGAMTPTDDKPIMFLFDPVDDVEDVRVTITDGSDREVGVIFGGVALQMYQPIYGGVEPLSLNASTEYQTARSATGQWLGRDITRQGGETTFSFRHLDPDWYRERFQPFVKSAELKPFFVKWRPDLYPDEVSYCHTTRDIGGRNMGGGHRLMETSITVRSHNDV